MATLSVSVLDNYLAPPSCVKDPTPQNQAKPALSVFGGNLTLPSCDVEFGVLGDLDIGLHNLRCVRRAAFWGLVDVDGCVKSFWRWSSRPDYLHVRKTDFEGGTEDKFIKASKRGNLVYRWRVDRRLEPLRDLPEVKFFDRDRADLSPSNSTTSTVLICLEYHSKKISLRDAWDRVSLDWDLFIRSLRQAYGEVDVLRTWEAHKSGYPHVHALLRFHDKTFGVFKRPGGRPGAKETFRITRKDRISRFWKHGYVDVLACWSLHAASSYITKYITKTLTTDKSSKSLFFCAMFRKRSYAVSGGFFKVLRRDAPLRNSDSSLDFSGLRCLFTYRVEVLGIVVLPNERDFVVYLDRPPDLTYLVDFRARRAHAARSIEDLELVDGYLPWLKPKGKG